MQTRSSDSRGWVQYSWSRSQRLSFRLSRGVEPGLRHVWLWASSPNDLVGGREPLLEQPDPGRLAAVTGVLRVGGRFRVQAAVLFLDLALPLGQPSVVDRGGGLPGRVGVCDHPPSLEWPYANADRTRFLLRAVVSW